MSGLTPARPKRWFLTLMIGRSRSSVVRRIPPHRIVAAVIAAVAQLFVNPNQGQPLALGLPIILDQYLIQVGTPGIDLRPGLAGSIIAELG